MGALQAFCFLKRVECGTGISVQAPVVVTGRMEAFGLNSGVRSLLGDAGMPKGRVKSSF